MGRRVLTVSELTFHERYKRDPKIYKPSDLDSKDLLDIFEKWAKELDIADTHDEERQSWVSVTRVTRYAPRVIVLDLRVGAYGEPGDIVDISKGEPVGKIKNNQAPTGENRAMLFVPKIGERAHFLSEESSRGSAGGRILSLFKSHFRENSKNITMETASVTEGEAWQEGAKLTEVEVRVTGKSADIADGLKVKVGKISHIARPERSGTFPVNLLRKLRFSNVAAEVVAVDELPEDHDVYVTMVRDGRSKKFQLGSEGSPAIREVLNDSNEATLDADKLVERCTETVRDLLSRTGGEWNAEWSHPFPEKARNDG